MATEQTDKLELVYTLFCDDVRLEVGNKLSLMGVFQNITVPQLPFALIKFAVVNHWRGEGVYQSEVRIMTPDRRQFLAASQPTQIDIPRGGFAGNISFFVSITFPVAGQYWVQTLINSNLFDEQPLTVLDARLEQAEDDMSDAVN
jgi:Family of unknown function (DUF6941)